MQRRNSFRAFLSWPQLILHQLTDAMNVRLPQSADITGPLDHRHGVFPAPGYFTHSWPLAVGVVGFWWMLILPEFVLSQSAESSGSALAALQAAGASGFAPESMSGASVQVTISSGTLPFWGSGQYTFLPAVTENTYRIIRDGELENTGAYTYEKTGPNSGRIVFDDSFVGEGFTQELTFLSRRHGTYRIRTTQGDASQSGFFEAFFAPPWAGITRGEAGEEGFSHGNAIGLGSSGDAYVAGAFSGQLTLGSAVLDSVGILGIDPFGNPFGSPTDGLITRMNSGGDFVWSRQFGRRFYRRGRSGGRFVRNATELRRPGCVGAPCRRRSL